MPLDYVAANDLIHLNMQDYCKAQHFHFTNGATLESPLLCHPTVLCAGSCHRQQGSEIGVLKLQYKVCYERIFQTKFLWLSLTSKLRHNKTHPELLALFQKAADYQHNLNFKSKSWHLHTQQYKADIKHPAFLSKGMA